MRDFLDSFGLEECIRQPTRLSKPSIFISLVFPAHSFSVFVPVATVIGQLHSGLILKLRYPLEEEKREETDTTDHDKPTLTRKGSHTMT